MNCLRLDDKCTCGKAFGKVQLEICSKDSESCKDAMAQNILVSFFLCNLPQSLIEKSRKRKLFNQGSLISNFSMMSEELAFQGRLARVSRKQKKINTFLQLFKNMIAFSSFLPRHAAIGYNWLHLDIRVCKVPCVGEIRNYSVTVKPGVTDLAKARSHPRCTKTSEEHTVLLPRCQ